MPRAIDSIINQTISCHEIIVIDDGSTDKTFEILKEYIENKQIVYKKTENKGVSAARNDAIKLASGDWISFLDSDDEWLPIKNEKQLEILNHYMSREIFNDELKYYLQEAVNNYFNLS